MHDHSHGHHHHEMNIKAIALPIVLSIFLVGLKVYGWRETDSVSLLSSLLDSGMDILVSMMNLAAVLYAAKPADDDHRHGHTAIEDIVGLVQASFIAASGLFLFYEAVRRFMNPSEVQNPETGISVLLVSIVVPLAIVLYQRMTLKKTKSVVLEADSLHYMTDMLMNGLIIVSIYIASMEGLGLVDPILGTVIAGYILWSAGKIGGRAFNHLMDKEVPEAEYLKIVEIIDAYEGALDYHALKTRYSGSKMFVQMHLDVDASLNLRDAHDIADGLEAKLEEAFHDAEVIVHLDPKELS
ncbi:MAG: cation diffusion facilitator family transporter [Rickettsiales bacterium]|nr:cation diffusion facilitator family transporter [Rickettsiales bacterium]